MLRVKRSSDSRVVKAILHRVADIPGGVTVSVAVLGGASLKEGTPIGAPDSSTGLSKVVKTAKIVTNAANDATEYEVAKGHHFKVGDIFSAGGANGEAITAIDKTTSAVKDTITLASTLGVAITAGTSGAIAFEAAGANTTLAVTPVAVVGQNLDVEENENLFVDAWVMAVVREANAPDVTSDIKSALKGVIYL